MGSDGGTVQRQDGDPGLPSRCFEEDDSFDTLHLRINIKECPHCASEQQLLHTTRHNLSYSSCDMKILLRLNVRVLVFSVSQSLLL